MLRGIPVLCALLLWEIVSRREIVNPLLFPAPTVVLAALWEWAVSGELLRDLTASFWRLALGFALGGALGACAGLLTGRLRLLDWCVTPLVQLFRPLPPVAIIPLVIVWLGIGNAAKVFSISFAVFFPVWLNAHLGAASIPVDYIRSARLLSKSRLRIAWHIILPASAPAIIAGLRTSLAIAFIMVYVAEIAGASAGIGYQISVSHLAYRIDKMMAALALLAALGALADSLFALAVRKLFPWTNGEDAR